MKGSQQIEREFYLKVKKPIESLISGKLYLNGMLPTFSTTPTIENAVIVFKSSGPYGQFQTGQLYINVYVPNREFKGTYIKDIARITELENSLMEIATDLTDNEYRVDLIETPQSYPLNEIKQHFINVRLKFRRITF